jgi:hypothetical protein
VSGETIKAAAIVYGVPHLEELVDTLRGCALREESDDGSRRWLTRRRNVRS